MGLFRRKAVTSRSPILMVRGFGEMAPLPHVMDDYRRDGYVVELMPAAASHSLDVVAHAMAVARHGRDLAERYQGRINLVGFSLGGIACLFALTRLALDMITDRFVSYGTPYQGTTIASLTALLGPASAIASQCTPGSQFLQGLRDDLPLDRVVCVSIGGTKDLICPADTTFLPHARHVTVARAHSDFLVSRPVHRAIRTHLK